MPSFDVVSEIDKHELTNAVDQASRVVDTRFDFKGANAKFTLNEKDVEASASADFQVKQMIDIIEGAVIKRGIDVRCLDWQEVVESGQTAKATAIIKQGIESEAAKKLVKMIKEQKFKVQAAIQGEQLRVTGKKRDDLQEVIAFLRQVDFEQPLQFNNFRD
jgi:uncharacterized protein YajQ (UPF0234 family)